MRQNELHDKDCTLLLRVSKSGLGHVGFSTTDAQGKVTHYDFNSIGMSRNCSLAFNLAVCGLSYGAGAVMSMTAAGAALYGAVMLGAALPVALGGSLVAGVSASLFGVAVGVLQKSDKASSWKTDEHFSLPITRAQLQQIEAYTHKNRYSVYSVSVSNCVDYTAKMLKSCGLKLPMRLCFNTPGYFSRAVQSTHGHIMAPVQAHKPLVAAPG